jgi:hypothetical protein
MIGRPWQNQLVKRKKRKEKKKKKKKKKGKLCCQSLSLSLFGFLIRMLPHTLALLALAATSAVAQDIMGVLTVREFVPDFRTAQPMCRGTAPGVNFDLDYDHDLTKQLKTPEFYFSQVMRSGGPWVCTCMTPGDSSIAAVRLCLGAAHFSVGGYVSGSADLHIIERKNDDRYLTQSTIVSLDLNGVKLPAMFTEQDQDNTKPRLIHFQSMTFPTQTTGGVPGTILRSIPPRGEIVTARGWRSPMQGNPGHLAIGMWYAFPKPDDPGLLCRAYRLLSNVVPAAEVAAIAKAGYKPQCLDLPRSVSGEE